MEEDGDFVRFMIWFNIGFKTRVDTHPVFFINLEAVAVSDGIIALSTNVLRSRFGKKCSKTIKIWRAEAPHLCGSDKLIFTIFEQKHTTFMFDVTSRHVISEEEKRSFFAGAFLV